MDTGTVEKTTDVYPASTTHMARANRATPKIEKLFVSDNNLFAVSQHK